MIPAGWALVPMIPTERMLNEFSGVWWPHCDREELKRWAKDKRVLEEQAYASMIAVAPTPPDGSASEIEALKAAISRKTRIIRSKDAEVNRAYKKLKNCFARLHAAEARIAELEAQ